MNYIELNIACADSAMREILTAELADFPFESFSDEGEQLKAYIPQERLAECMEAVNTMLDGYGIRERRYVQIEAQNWNALWESNFEEVMIDNRAVIRAPFHAPHPELGQMDMVIMPKMSFGTGHHATTYLMTEYILDGDVRGKTVLDVGCGTGILAIAAAKCGADHATGVDIDDFAVESAIENISANHVEGRVTILKGDVTAVAGGAYDVILANINRNILLHDLAAYAALLTAGGHLYISGFLEQDTASLTECAAQNGLHCVSHKTRTGWVAAEFVK